MVMVVPINETHDLVMRCKDPFMTLTLLVICDSSSIACPGRIILSSHYVNFSISPHRYSIWKCIPRPFFLIDGLFITGSTIIRNQILKIHSKIYSKASTANDCVIPSPQ